MKGYKRFSIYLSDDVVNEINAIVEYRNKRILKDNEDKKPRTIEEFIKGSTMQLLKSLKGEGIIAGMDDLGKPYKLKNRFKELMIERKMKQKDVCEITDIEPANISRIFSNENQPS